VLTDRIRQLRCIVVLELPCFLCRDNDEPARTNELSNQHVYVFIEIELNGSDEARSCICPGFAGEGLGTNAAVVPPSLAIERVCPHYRSCLELPEQVVVFRM
jgi:hypothetical protein